MANVKSVVLIIGRGYTMRTRLRRDKPSIPNRAQCDSRPAGPRPTYGLNNNFKRMSHCISDYSDLSPLNRDITCLNMLLANKKKEKSSIEYHALEAQPRLNTMSTQRLDLKNLLYLANVI